MSTTLLDRTIPSHFGSYSREEVFVAVHDFYKLLIQLPYIDPNALVLPPQEGWVGVDVEGLRRRGKTEEVIELLRHLPYLRSPAPRRRWAIGPDTLEIAYCDGELYKEVIDSIQPVPGHCIWLTDCDSRDGTGLLLDTRTGSLTEWSMLGQTVMIDYEDYEKIPTSDRWMAHHTMHVTKFFQLWRRKFEKLIWMAVYDPRGQGGTAQWYSTANTPQEMEDMLQSDDDFDPGDGDELEVGAEEEGSLSSDHGKDEDVDDDGQIEDEEVDDLMEDAYGIEARQKRMELLSQETTTAEQATASSLQPPSEQPEDQPPSRWAKLERKTKEVYEIHKSNGWPSGFDQESCKKELAAFMEGEEPPLGAMSEQEALVAREKMMERLQEKQRRRA